MDNLRSVIELLFAKRDINELLNSFTNKGKIGEVVDKDAFKRLYRNNDSWYSGDQLNSLFEIVNKTWRKNRILSNSQAGENLFNILTQMSGEVLTVDGGEPYCKSEEYLRWHDITEYVGEDILVTNYLAAADIVNQYPRINFLWQPNLLSNNNEIRHIAEKGLADLHCHLYGSAQIGALSWIELMNFPESFGERMFDVLQNMDDGYRKVMLAAFLRVVLFSWVTETSDDDFDNTIQFWLDKQDKLLAVEFIIREMQTRIDYLRYCKTHKEDYAIPDTVELFSQGIESRIVYSGERWLLYHCFKKIYRSASNSVINSMLYIYLNIKSQFMYDMVQVNKDIGFENFMYYDGKKGNFLDIIKLYENEYANSAVNLGVQGTNVKYVEYRITPKDTKQNLFSSIQYLSPYTEKLKDKIDYGFIVHFIKKKDADENYTPSIFNVMRCRNYALRQNLEVEANNIYEIVCDGYDKIIGIDAANSEFYCRPEVYGPAFRKLRYATPGQNICYYKPDSVRRLGITFHVGEDFYDIVDGLRAVDEAIMFLNLRNGDRMGHGTVLGLDAEKFYERINYTVVMPKQVLIDNIVWLLHNIKCYGISGVDSLVEMLKAMYDTYVSYVYGEYINRHIYRKSWLLRGDNPDFYNSDGFIQRGGCLDYQITNCAGANDARIVNYACKMYHRYHYDVGVKSKGFENVEVKIEKEFQVLFIKVIKEIQKRMQDMVSQRRIAIESNPTSNVRIEHIDKYENHPISKFNNKGLEVRKGNKEWSAQIPATINTDDAGIFATSLEKEFTLMAVALDKAVDENKERKYEPQSIYSWIDIIRNNALKYAFGKNRFARQTEYYPMETNRDRVQIVRECATYRCYVCKWFHKILDWIRGKFKKEEVEPIELDLETKYWLHRVNYEGLLSLQLLKQGYLSIGFSDIGRADNMANGVEELYHNNSGNYSTNYTMLKRFVAEMKTGDIVIVPLIGDIFNVYEILDNKVLKISDIPIDNLKDIDGKTITRNENGYLTNGERIIDLGFFRKVKVIATDVPVSEVKSEGYFEQFGLWGTTFKLSDASAIIESIPLKYRNNDTCGIEKAITYYKELRASNGNDMINAFKRYLNSVLDGEEIYKNNDEYDLKVKIPTLDVKLLVNIQQDGRNSNKWAIEQVKAYKAKQYNDMRPGLLWLVFSDYFISEKVKVEAGLGIKLISRKDFLEMCMNVKFVCNNINYSYKTQLFYEKNILEGNFSVTSSFDWGYREFVYKDSKKKICVYRVLFEFHNIKYLQNALKSHLTLSDAEYGIITNGEFYSIVKKNVNKQGNIEEYDSEYVTYKFDEIDIILNSSTDIYTLREQQRQNKLKFLLKLVGSDFDEQVKKIDGGKWKFIKSSDEDAFWEFLMQYGEEPNETQPDMLCKYTSLDTLVANINYGTIRLNGLAGMNDTTEVDYVDKYCGLTPTDSNNAFIISFTPDEEDLVMSRLYAEDAKGVCMKYKKLPTNDGSFTFHKIIYSERMGNCMKLDILKTLINNGLQLDKYNIWKQFFKPYDYKQEREVRLLYVHSRGNEYCNIIWNKVDSNNIVNPAAEFKIADGKLPLELQKIILGPKCPEKDLNENQIRAMIKDKEFFRGKNIIVTTSSIDNYR